VCGPVGLLVLGRIREARQALAVHAAGVVG